MRSLSSVVMGVFLSTLIDSTFVAPSATALAACSAISFFTNASTEIYPSALGDPAYLTAKDHYWSAANADYTPACVVFPTSAEHVSQIVQLLLNYTDVEFALKSGGHNPNVGFASTDGGVLISFSSLANTTYNAEEGTADIGPGARWGDVLTALESENVAVVGGRIGKCLNSERRMITD